MIQKIYLKMWYNSCANNYHDVPIFQVNGMVQNIRKLISQEPNKIFLWNKKHS